jgi:hypothetical protein
MDPPNKPTDGDWSESRYYNNLPDVVIAQTPFAATL